MRRKVTASCLCVLAAVATACNDDGRTLRDPGPGQTGSVSTTAAPTTIGAGEVDGGLVDSGGLLPAASGTPGALTAPWRDGAEIDPHYTCDGADVSPALVWDSSPEGTVEVAVTLTDLDQPDLVHWVMTGLDPARTTLGEGEVPVGAVQATNDLGIVGYSGPCNDPGTVDRYQYTVHFLSQQMESGEGDPGRDVRLAVNSATFSSAQVVGLYSRY